MSAPAHFEAHLSTLTAGLKVLPDKPEETARSTLAALWHFAAGNPVSADLAVRTPLPELDGPGSRTLAELIERRLDGVPLAHLTGRQRFMGLEFLVGPEALVPRKETELLATAALELIDGIEEARAEPTVLDVCTGVGNVALGLAHHRPTVRVHAADLSAEAVGLADRNCVHLALTDRVDFRVGDLLEPFAVESLQRAVDMVTCNPPYISTGKVDHMPKEIASHEPKLAFDGGPFGLTIVGRLTKEAPRYLRSDGWLIFEVGLGQGELLAKRLSTNPDYRRVRSFEDPSGRARVLALQVK